MTAIDGSRGDDQFRILLLGEGNFSFSNSLLNRVRSLDLKYQVVTTSFDSKEQVISKYPDSLFSLNEIGRNHLVETHHNIDATNLNKSGISGQVFTDIIFNFPHLGKEDCNDHSSMLAHIMHSCIPLMNDKSTLTITLAETQGNLWRIHEMASRNNLQLVSELNFVANEWPGYVLMRHHVGKSFGGRVQRCLHYSFRLESNSNISEHSYLLQLLHEHKLTLTSIMKETPAEVIVSQDSKSKPSKVKRKALDVMVEGKYHKVSLESGNANTTTVVVSTTVNKYDAVSGLGWQCDFCGKVLSTEQGVKTHVYAHVLAATTNSSNSSDTSLVPVVISDRKCPHCDKAVPNEDALMQHIRAKHGLFDDIKPDWAKSQKKTDDHNEDCSSSSESSVVKHSCVICGVLFDSEEALQSHVQLGFQPQGVTLSHSCTRCSKVFSDERGLKQHMNFCWTNEGSTENK